MLSTWRAILRDAHSIKERRLSWRLQYRRNWNTQYHEMLVLIFFAFLARNVAGETSNGVRLMGVGASFPAEVYQSWTAAFENDRRDYIKLDHKYYEVGSGVGKELIVSEGINVSSVTYVATDSLLQEDDYAFNPNLQMIPVMAG
jgi:ABC-type phosphate transport system substrate-binding protein